MSRSSRAFRHEALLHRGVGGFLDGAVPFIRDGLAAGETILVMVGEDKSLPLGDRLGDDADALHMADMREAGRNPGRIIPTLDGFVDEHRGSPGIRVIGEPVWPGRAPAEVVECQLHESLVDRAFAAVDGLWLLCPYDVSALEDHVLAEAVHGHRTITDGAAGRDNPEYRNGTGLPAPFDAPLPRPAARAEVLAFEREQLADVRRCAGGCAAAIGLPAEKTNDLILAISEIAANSIRHGGGRGVLRVWGEDRALVCEVRDRGHIRDPLAGRRKPTHVGDGGWGLWLTHNVCDLVQVRSSADGTVVRLLMRA